MFGDILTDEAAILAGSLGMLPSASLAGVPKENGKAMGLYEPIHGTAPDIAGQGKANPIATIMSVALMLRYSLGLNEPAVAIEESVNEVLEKGFSTEEMGQKILQTVQIKLG